MTDVTPKEIGEIEHISFSIEADLKNLKTWYYTGRLPRDFPFKKTLNIDVFIAQIIEQIYSIRENAAALRMKLE